MPDFDMKSVKVGDTVDVRLRVTNTEADGLGVCVNGLALPISIALSHIIAHHPAPRKLEVGSQVRCFGIVGTVKAIFEKEAWVHVDGAGCATYRLGELNVHSDLEPSQ